MDCNTIHSQSVMLILSLLGTHLLSISCCLLQHTCLEDKISNDMFDPEKHLLVITHYYVEINPWIVHGQPQDHYLNLRGYATYILASFAKSVRIRQDNDLIASD